jgi:hypothetical protein
MIELHQLSAHHRFAQRSFYFEQHSFERGVGNETYVSL